MTITNRLGTRWWLLLCILTLTACGFHLRGKVVLPAVMNATYVEGDKFSLLVRELGSILRQSGANVVTTRSQATAVLKVEKEAESRRVLSVGTTGKASEYEIYHSVVYSLYDAHGKALVGQQTLSAKRDYQFDENDVLGKANEEEQLREEMQRDLALRIAQRLSVLAR